MAVFIHGVCVCVDFLHDFPVSPHWREHRLNCWRKSTFCASCIWYKFLALARPWCWVFIFTVFTVVAPDFPSHLKPSSPDFLSHVIIDDPTKGAPWGHSWLPSSPFNIFFFFGQNRNSCLHHSLCCQSKMCPSSFSRSKPCSSANSYCLFHGFVTSIISFLLSYTHYLLHHFLPPQLVNLSKFSSNLKNKNKNPTFICVSSSLQSQAVLYLLSSFLLNPWMSNYTLLY